MARINKKFIFFIFITFIFAFFQGGNLPYSIFYGFLVTFLAAIIYITTEKKALEFQVRFNRKVYSTLDEDEFSIVVKNLSILPAPYVTIQNKAFALVDPKYSGDNITLNPDEIKWIKNRVKFIKRGIYDFGELNITFSDLFHIFEGNKRITNKILIRVYPKIYTLNRITANGNDIFKSAFNTKSNIEDMYTIKDVRKYNPGDSLKKINWKVSAKHNELYVRNFDTVSAQESNLFLDLNIDNLRLDPTGGLEEQLVDFCASIVNHMNISGVRSKLIINSRTPKYFNVDNKEDFNELMEFFLIQESDSEVNFTRFINANMNRVPKSSWMGILTLTLDNFLMDNLVSIKDRGYNITVFYYADGLSIIEKAKFLKKVGIEAISFNEMLNKGKVR